MFHHKLETTLARLAVVSLLATTASPTDAAKFTTEGRGEARLFQQGVLRETQTATFTVSVSQTNWFIKVKQTGSSVSYQDAAWLEYHTFRQGSNTFTLGYFDEATTARARRNFPDYQLQGMAWVERTVVPRGDSSIWISPLWYALCSPDYLAGQSEGAIEAPYNIDGDVEYYQKGNTNVAARWRVAPDALNLPAEILFLHSGKGRDQMGNERKLPEPFASGFTNATLRTEFVTAEQGAQRPSSIAFRVSYPERRNDGSAALSPVVEVDLHIERFANAPTEFDFQSAVKGAFMFTDRRFMNPGFEVARLNYTTNRLLADEEAMALPQFAVRKQQALAAAAHRETTKVFRFALIGFVALSAAGLAWIAWKRKTTN